MIIIGDKTFKTKKKAQEFVQGILNSCPIGGPLKERELFFISSLLSAHPDAENKIGAGIKSMTVRYENRFNTTKCFWVTREDDSVVDFSIGKCLSSKLNEPIKLFSNSARGAIDSQIITYKKDYFKENMDIKGRVKCKITGTLVDEGTCHVDHTPPNTFIKITKDFIKINKIDISNVKFLEGMDGIGTVFASEELISQFSKYHKEVAKLRIVSIKANLGQKKK